MFTRCLMHFSPVFASVGRQASNLASHREMDLKTVINKLNEFAPLQLAKDWDNVGLLVEPSTDPHLVSHILLTNDLTLKVLNEAISKNANLIISYHPPIFSPIKRLTQLSWKEATIIKCIEKQIAVYSPHTCWDVVKGGTNDWLISPFVGKTDPLLNHMEQKFKILIKLTSSCDDASKQNVLEEVDKIKCDDVYFDGSSIRITCSKHQMKQLDRICTNNSIEIHKVESPHSGYGEGRKVMLDVPLTIRDIVQKVKIHLNLDKVQLAMGYTLNLDSLVTSIAVCAGSGSSVLRGVDADLMITGEMSHHDALDVCHQRNGTSTVILCGHSNTERGFLSVMLQHLQEVLNNSVTISISQSDCDPLTIV